MVSQPMATIEPLPVFISYACKEGAALAQCVQSDLTKGGLDAWLETPLIGGGAVLGAEIEHEVDTRQATIELLSPRSYLRRTMRPRAGSREHMVSLLDLAQSGELLARCANLEPAELPNGAEEVIAECGRLPLAFSVVDPMLRNMGREIVYAGLTIHSPDGPPS
jgi:hypothetical protein